MPPSSAPSLQDVIHLVEVDEEARGPLGRLQVASALVRELAEVGDAALGYFVDRARHAGHSWSEIGEALGVTKQAAQQKHTARLSLGTGPATFERFTPRARNVVAAAEAVAREWEHAYIGTEHLLLALYAEPDGLAAQILVESGLPADAAEAAVGRRTQHGAGAPDGRLPFTPKAAAVFSGALASAVEMGHNYIGTEHLLLGLARGEGLAAEVLDEAALTHQALAAKVFEKLSRYVQQRGVRNAVKRTVAKTSGAKKRSATKKKPG